MLHKSPAQVVRGAHIRLVWARFTFEDVNVVHEARLRSRKCSESNPSIPLRTQEACASWEATAGICLSASRDGRWRRGESNPRPKSLTFRSLHAYLVRLGFRQRPSATSNHEPPTSLFPVARVLARDLQAESPKPARQSTPLSVLRAERRRRATLIRQRRHTACWQLSLSHADYGWCGPPACLLDARTPVETGTPPS